MHGSRSRASDDHDMIEIPGVGFVSYAWLEREAICIESGMSEREALRVASTDYQRSVAMDVAKPKPSTMGGNSYSLPLAKSSK